MIYTLWYNVNKYMGWRNWAVFYYNSILENLFILFYLGLVNKQWTNADLLKIGLYILFSISATSYGYLINDLSDRQLDALHDKPNTFADDSKTKSLVIVIFFLLSSILLSLPFIQNALFLPMTVLWYFLATFYSLKPIRFKERGLTGLIIIILTQKVIPIFLVFLAFEYYAITDIILIICLLFMRGAGSDIYHQIADHGNDSTTDTKTFAVLSGIKRINRLYNNVLILERFFMFLVLSLILLRLFSVKAMGLPYFVSPLMIYIILLIALKFKFYPPEYRNPFSEPKNLYQVVHLVFPNIILPILFLLPLMRENVNYLVFIVLYILIFKLYKIDTLKNTFIGKYISDKF